MSQPRAEPGEGLPHNTCATTQMALNVLRRTQTTTGPQVKRFFFAPNKAKVGFETLSAHCQGRRSGKERNFVPSFPQRA
jgi:hypothetical protein